jgi:predicted Holliday junction resolvase-like endonuclease
MIELIIVGGCVAVVSGGVFWWFTKKLRKDLAFFKDKYKKMLHQKKSSEVRIGKIGENMAPFLDGWPYDPNRFRFLGNPVDGIQFTDEEIIFVEVKTGKSRLSRGQKNAREIIRSGNVRFATFRIGETGSTFTIDDYEEE